MFSLSALECFYEDELEAMLCGVGEQWSVNKLAESIKCDHGCYSPPCCSFEWSAEMIVLLVA